MWKNQVKKVWVLPVSLLTVVIAGLIFIPSQWRDELQLRVRGAESGIWSGNRKIWARSHCHALSHASDCRCIALLHGIGDEALGWGPLLSAEPEDFARPVQLVALSLPEIGGGPVRELAKRVVSTLRDAPPPGLQACSRWTVVGSGFGGALGVWMAADFSETVERLLLVGSLGASFQRAQSKLGQNGEKTSAIDVVDSALTSVRAPALLFWGEQDGVTPPAEGREIARRVSGAAFREGAGCGHFPQRECPGALISALNELLQYGAF